MWRDWSKMTKSNTVNYKQKHPETCLAKCLMILLEKAKGEKIPDKYELEFLLFSLKYKRKNIAIGHLEKVVRDFEINIKWIADSKIFFDFVKKKNLSKQISFS